MTGLRVSSRFLPVIGLALVVSACGGGTAAPKTASATAATRPSQLALADRAAACLRSHGVKIPDPTAGKGGRPKWDYAALGGTSQAARQAAIAACRSELVAARVPGVVPNAAAAAAGVRYAQCMRQHGLPSFPDPGPSGTFTGASSISGHGIDTSSPLFKSANTACKSELAKWHAAIGGTG